MSYATEDWGKPDDITRPIPHALQSEKSALSLMFQEPRKFIPLAIEARLTERHFYLPNHAILFPVLLELYAAGKEVELISLNQNLTDCGKIDRVGGPSALADLLTYEPNPDIFAIRVNDLWTKFNAREILRIANEAITGVYDSPDDIQSTLERAKGRIGELDAGGGPSNLTTQLECRAFDFDQHPEKPIPLFKLCGMSLCTPGNVMNIQALPKAGKSAVVESKIAAIFNGSRQGPDTLGFSAENPKGFALIHFDTEQSRFDHDALVRRAVRRAGIHRTPEWFLSYSVADLDIRDRRLALRQVMHEARQTHGGIFAVLIDGIGDLCGDPNDSEESFGLVHELHALAITHDCAIITVLHENPGSESGKTRGHLGSQLERKAETNLRLAKDSNGVTTMWAERARHCYLPKEQGPCFSWNDQAAMHTSCGTAGEIKSAANREKMQDESDRAFGGASSLSYSDLSKAIMNALEVSERTAKARIKSWLAEGITLKNSAGNHYLANP